MPKPYKPKVGDLVAQRGTIGFGDHGWAFANIREVLRIKDGIVTLRSMRDSVNVKDIEIDQKALSSTFGVLSETEFLIVSPNLLAESPDGMFWSNEDGWGAIETATRFALSDVISGRLPIGGEWIGLREAHVLARTSEAGFGLDADGIKKLFAEEGEHPYHQQDKWIHSVSNGDTKLGYWEWVLHEVESAHFDAMMAGDEAGDVEDFAPRFICNEDCIMLSMYDANGGVKPGYGEINIEWIDLPGGKAAQMSVLDNGWHQLSSPAFRAAVEHLAAVHHPDSESVKRALLDAGFEDYTDHFYSSLQVAP